MWLEFHYYKKYVIFLAKEGEVEMRESEKTIT
jgi:hypothetical protein